MTDLPALLESLNFTESERKTYLLSLERGPSTVLEIADQTGFTRQAIYLAIENLKQRGLMSSLMRGRKQFFIAEHPDKLLAYAERHARDWSDRVSQLKKAIPEIVLHMGGEKPVVHYYEGVDGMKAIIDDLAHAMPSEVLELADLDAMFARISPEDLLPVKQALTKIRTRIQAIYSGLPAARTVQGERYALPESMKGFKSDVIVYGDKIAMATFEGKMHSVIIENSNLAQALRHLFKLAIGKLEADNKRI